ncbi:hypothetical protein NY2A_b521R [Paramecium bursaria Chlorella virus NY2A]|uniref:Uncharacterized protein b521R n=1 Tax=Paramecium bursaria Chlorella virus NY2A TaxID=46021 RepID=A7IX46_PBCVN|nr:hypothetical protein NY2A_b521R [Paramecium bursaria Chlorella virus NY2A]ABT14920.1 hypothetical protein NY2A_b521R [Paramecium bursaria Chlorella virus NY2A]
MIRIILCFLSLCCSFLTPCDPRVSSRYSSAPKEFYDDTLPNFLHSPSPLLLTCILSYQFSALFRSILSRVASVVSDTVHRSPRACMFLSLSCDP